MRWNQILPRPQSSVVPFVSDLEIGETPIDSLGFTPELMDSGDVEEKEEKELQISLRELREKFFEKETLVKALLENDLLSHEKKEEIKQAWEKESVETQRELSKRDSLFTAQHGKTVEKKERYKGAQKTQRVLKDKYGYDSKVNGKSLFEKLITEGDDFEWFYENLLTEEEQEYILQLRKEREQGEDVLLQKNLIDTARLRTIERVKKEIDERLEKTHGAKETMEGLFLVEERDKKVFDTAKEYIVKTLGEAAWGDLEKRAKVQAEESKVDIEAWKTNQKGFGKNNSKNRKNRLIDVAEPLRKERKKIYDEGWEQSRNMICFLTELQRLRYSLEDDYGPEYNIENIKGWFDMPKELQEVARHVYEALPTKDILKHINSLKNATFLDADQDHEVTKKLGKLELYLLRERNGKIENLEITISAEQQGMNQKSNKISEELNKFPDTPLDYYKEEGIKK